MRIDVREGVPIGRITCPHVSQREAGVIQDDLTDVLGEHRHRAAVDFSNVTMLGSVGLGTLITVTRFCSKGGGKLAIFGLSRELHDLIKLSRLDRVLLITSSEDEAMKKLR
jgi:anti-sigma B factor antagonist